MSARSDLVLIALGSNEESVWGTPKDTVQKAMLELAKLPQTGLKFSRMYQTPAFPAGVGPDFVNVAAVFFTSACPRQILDDLHRIEAAAGRARSHRWGQRTLDLDLIAVGDQVVPSKDHFEFWRHLSPEEQAFKAPDELILPHPRVQDRAFVLVPLADVAPDWRHPVLGQSVAEMLADLLPSERASVRPLPD